MKSVIPTAVRREAISIVASQPITPISPGKVQAGQPCLCAAAALAIAALRVEGRIREAQDLSWKLCLETQRQPVEDIFRSRGWGEDTCDAIFAANDQFEDTNRTEEVIQLLKNID